MKMYFTTAKFALAILISFFSIFGIHIMCYAQVVTDPNTAPVFTNGDSTDRYVRENTAASENIGNPISATDDDDDTLTYSLSGTDAASFEIDSETGQLKTSAALDYETKNEYSVTITVSDGNGGEDSIDVTIKVRDVVDLSTPLNDRTRKIRNAIVNRISGVNNADNVGDRHLLQITTLNLQNQGISTLQSGDFSGLTNLENLLLGPNSLSRLPEDIFEGLSNLEYLTLFSNSLRSLPEDIFEGLSNLEFISLSGNLLTTLPEDIFEGLSNLGRLRLHSMEANTLSRLPEDIFEGLSNLTELKLDGNSLSRLPADIFDGLSNLETLDIAYNDLTRLPDGIFEGLTSLSTLELNNNERRLACTASLIEVADGEFKAVVNTGAPFDMALSVSANEYGSIDDDVISVTVLQGNLESDVLTVTSNPNIYQAVTVTIDDPLPTKPNAHRGYRIAKSNALPIEVFPGTSREPVFTEGSDTERSVQENTASDRNIGDSVTATSYHSDYTIAYTLSGTDDDSFSIDATSGQLKTDAALDYETKNSYSVTITATDDDDFSSTIDVTINVTDVNEAPQFSGTSTTLSVDENTARGVNIGDPVSATDPDAGDTLTYTLGGTDRNRFRINSETGQLRTHAALDYETKTSYSMIVRATDTGDKKDDINVTINVNDNEAPQFSEDSTTRSVDENTARGVNIGDPVSATDPDADDTLTYTLGGPNGNRFRINSETGQLRTHARLDYETHTSHSVIVSVEDTDGQTDDIDVTINVNDVFDESTSLSDRTSEVVDAIVDALPDADSSDDVTDADLDSITSLDLSGAVDSLQNGDFSGLSALETLNLDSNSLTTIPRNVFNGLSALKDLDLSDNSLTSVHQSVFNGLSALEDLDLSDNSLTTLPHHVFNGLSALETLDLSDNGLTSVAWPVFEYVAALETLDLSGNSLTTLSWSVFEKLSALETLDLSNNNLTTVHADAFEEMSVLKDLDLSDNSFTTIPGTLFEDLSALETLDLSDNSLTTLSGTIFEEVSTLKNIDLSNNSLSSLPNDIFKGLTVNDLYLAGNTTDPFTFNVKLEKSGNSGVKVVIPKGTTYHMFVRVIITNGTGSYTSGSHSSEGATLQVNTYAGKTRSELVAVTRNSGETGAVTAKLDRFVTTLPSDHTGYAYELDDTTVTVLPAENDNDGRAPSNVEQIPEITAFLPNYPNPFNPETWIPYQLSTPADVTVTIYNIRGIVVRKLALGHQPAGYYTNRSRAAHWDGRNTHGERVGSGIYFYRLQADDMSTLRKMVILK